MDFIVKMKARIVKKKKREIHKKKMRRKVNTRKI